MTRQTLQVLPAMQKLERNLCSKSNYKGRCITMHRRFKIRNTAQRTVSDHRNTQDGDIIHRNTAPAKLATLQHRKSPCPPRSGTLAGVYFEVTFC